MRVDGSKFLLVLEKQLTSMKKLGFAGKPKAAIMLMHASDPLARTDNANTAGLPSRRVDGSKQNSSPAAGGKRARLNSPSKEIFMKFFSSNLDSLRKLYINQLQMLLSTEQQITEALPKMIDKATDNQLKQAFQSHLQETRTHVTRLEEILKRTAGEVKTIKCKVLASLVDEAEDMIKDASDESVRDAALIAAAQRVEHYEIATYGAVKHFAQILGEQSQAELLNQTIKEEGHADHVLTEIANRVNPYADKAA